MIRFLYIAKGSAGEVRNMTHACDRLGFAHLAEVTDRLRELAASCSRQAFLDKLDAVRRGESTPADFQS